MMYTSWRITNSHWRWIIISKKNEKNNFCVLIMRDELTVELDKDHLMWPEEYDVDILHYDAVVQDNNEEE